MTKAKRFDDLDLVGTDWSSLGSAKWKTFDDHGGGFVRCCDTHPPLPLGAGRVIRGGSCIVPAVTDANVYIGLDRGMARTDRALPWTPGFEVLFPIPDMRVPENPTRFRELVDWTIGRIEAGDTVHAGCIGGHGRTGLLLSAVVMVMLGEEDAIGYVRKHYCDKAVETGEQIAFLGREFGIRPVAGSRKSKGGNAGGSGKGEPRGIPYVRSGLSIW